ncbi:TonB-dependent receptor domain-containing protein [Roseateles toxinivorans]|uniref:Iron complex outermembrane receptor protein n=1 Tax=Roseateles toxinivorans TaxID=270368 RepID=A0A4R6QR11_9BURK|nr:TonB-dependent receptor [Roseateles toxinivorans]TDP73193.1 iron complex outermembrane receptor protein [Roseateles toxinivorans]
MFRRNQVNFAAMLCLGALSATPALAQQQLDRIEITGSSIRRIANESALPVQVITAEQIRGSGATSVADVIQRLPSMQGFAIADTAIGSNSGGIATASIHDIGASYTLVLLNGRRVAPTGSGSTINLAAIPMSAIERIEVLTDGASALYGSDAIAGVVNFVLKRNIQGGTVTVQADSPLEGGGKSANASVTYGFGNLDKDRFNVVATYRHDEQKPMKSGDREFAKSAYLPFEYNGRKYIYDRTSTSADPANATVTFKRLGTETTTLPAYAFNPYYKTHGNTCAPNNVYSLSNAATATSVSEMCAFDFVSTIDVYPESKRDSFYMSGQFKASNTVTLFTDIAYSRMDLTARIAPNPVPVSIPVTSSLFTKYVAPYLTADQIAHINTVTANYRATDFGTRDSQTITDSKHFVIGAEAEVGNWLLSTAATWSQNAIDEKYVGGYFKDKEFRDIVKNVSVDPFVPSGGQSAAAQSLIAGSIFNGSVRSGSTTLTGLDVRASGDLFKLPAGTVGVGVGADVRNNRFKNTPSASALAGEIYNYAPVTAFDLERSNAGVFAEVLVPVVKNLELTGALRYDTIGAIKDAVNNKDVGERVSATTYKLSARYQVSNAVLLRGSYGTGFKAASMLDIAQPLIPNGVTAANYDCPFPGTPACKPTKTQYSQMAGGNDQMKPEKSKQGTVGIRFEPTADFGIGADYWNVKMTDAVSGVSANQAFADPQKYKDLFTLYRTPAETQDYWAFKSVSTNIGKANYSGVDWDVVARFQTGIGRLTTGLAGTYMIESSYTRAGTDNDFTDSMGKYGENAAVTFRNIIRGTLKLETGAFTNLLTVKLRSGYKDITTTARDVATNKNVAVSVDVPRYGTLDWQGTYKHSKALELRVGINNLLNEAPPFTLRDSSGHQVGYDPRYADPKMRTLYMMGTYNF